VVESGQFSMPLVAIFSEPLKGQIIVKAYNRNIQHGLMFVLVCFLYGLLWGSLERIHQSTVGAVLVDSHMRPLA